MKIAPSPVSMILFLLAMSFCACLCGAKAKQPIPRRYELGPLKVEEFRGKVDVASPAGASTQTRVMINYEYNVKSEKDRFKSQLTSIEVFAVFLRKESWWRYPDSQRLLDHEQGHFDIAQIAARRLQLVFDKILAAGSAVVSGTGDSQQQATEVMEDKLRKLLRLVNEQAVNENQEYDRITSHGTRRRAQFEQRRIQKVTLQRLEKQLRPVPGPEK